MTFPSEPLIPREDSKTNGQVVYVEFLKHLSPDDVDAICIGRRVSLL